MITATYEFSGNWQALMAGFDRAQEIVADELYRFMVEADQFLEREAKDRMPTASGIGRASMFSSEQKLPYGAIGVTGSPLPHVAFVELGTRPHFPPIEPLQDWVRLKFGVPESQTYGIALAIARKIAARGTLAVGMYHRAFAAGKPMLERMVGEARDRVVARLAGP